MGIYDVGALNQMWRRRIPIECHCTRVQDNRSHVLGFFGGGVEWGEENQVSLTTPEETQLPLAKEPSQWATIQGTTASLHLMPLKPRQLLFKFQRPHGYI